MLGIASSTDIQQQAIITYNIDGLPGSTMHKNFMYEAKTIKHLKEKLIIFDSMQNEMHKPSYRCDRKIRKVTMKNLKKKYF